MDKKRLQGIRVAVLAADGFEQVELTVPMKKLKSLGAEVEVISLRTGKIRGMNLLLPGKAVCADRRVQDAEVTDYDALLLPGGFFNPDFLRQSGPALALVRAFDQTGKPIAFLCHAPQILISAGLVQGRRLTSWPGIKSDVQNAGGEWLDEPLVRDRNWVSSRGPQDLVQFQEAMVALFAEHMPAAARAPRPAAGGARVVRWAAKAAAVAAAVTVLAAGGNKLAPKFARAFARKLARR